MVNCIVYPSSCDVKRRVITAVCMLYRHDRELLGTDTNERSITHKLAEYLQREFIYWHVDCEYNRSGFDPKRLLIDSWHVQPCDSEAKTVFPDIIVHKRLTKQNLIVIEVEKANGAEDTKDVEKLETFTDGQQYGYQYGLFLRLAQNRGSELKLYQDGLYKDDWTSDLQRELNELGYGE